MISDDSDNTYAYRASVQQAHQQFMSTAELPP